MGRTTRSITLTTLQRCYIPLRSRKANEACNEVTTNDNARIISGIMELLVLVFPQAKMSIPDTKHCLD